MFAEPVCHRADAVTPLNPQPMRRRDDRAAARLFDIYGRHGGLATTDEIIQLMRPHWRQPISVLARWIVNHRVVSFGWRTQLLLPLFQFVPPRMAPLEAVSEAASALGECLDDEGIASWFIEPASLLDQCAPFRLVLSNPDGVIDAARRTRAALVERRARLQ